MALHVGERHIGQACCIQSLPEVLIEHRLTGRRLPALALPPGHPGAKSIDQVFAVGPQGEVGMARQLRQARQQSEGCLQLHAVVGGRRIGSTELLHTAVFETNQRTPAPGTGVSAAGSIGGRCNNPPSAIAISH